MGFADLSIEELAESYNLTTEEITRLCDDLGIAYRDAQTRLALEDAKEVILTVLRKREATSSDPAEGSA
ncbi:translation initiation factor IF-2 [Leptolyngbya sp. FACHB-261]|uniref:translation initiation factor IF-2 n=1 Tax=Leptolyngbya sp. FACHB-261 TaxID=2692806 RepID=UPI001684B797|nr:translation initiation factor IF-2 [Leptolyngbya sp. FACHB-261]MBD2101573.1 translation initiation factor IF-2 [Leptolyngbya sp. FACHB-261]